MLSFQHVNIEIVNEEFYNICIVFETQFILAYLKLD
jgi:hypothetical protein